MAGVRYRTGLREATEETVSSVVTGEGRTSGDEVGPGGRRRWGRMRLEHWSGGRPRTWAAGLSAALLLALAACGPGPRPGFLERFGGAALPGVFGQAIVAPRPAPLPPAEPRVVTEDGQTLAGDAWTNRVDLRLSAALSSPDPGAVVLPEVEILPADQPFTGTPNLVGEPGATTVTAPPLGDGRRYHWQVRARDLAGRSGPWVRYPGTLGFAVTPPAAPQIEPLPDDGFVAQRDVEVRWKADAGPPGIAGYAYSVDQDAAGGAPLEQPNATDGSATVTTPADGDWYVHVRALDGAGNWGPATTLPIHVDTRLLAFGGVTYTTAVHNAAYDGDSISFTLTKPASVSVTVLNPSGETVRALDLGAREGKVALEWDGRDAQGVPVAAGAYRFRIDAQGRAGTTASQTYEWLRFSSKRIVVSLGQQRMTAYDGDTVILSTLVTTGGPELPTPVGTFEVLARYSPFTFKSPWPKGSPYWYPDSPASYALLFDWGGFFVHDAPWRSNFGPGSNSQRGTPGGNATGTHGCVNVPYGVQRQLFFWADVGTPVIVQW